MAFGGMWRSYAQDEALVIKGEVKYGPGRVLALKKCEIVSFRDIVLTVKCEGSHGLYTADGYKVDLVVKVAVRLEKRDKSIMRALHVFGPQGIRDPRALHRKFKVEIVKLLTGIAANSVYSGIESEIRTRVAEARTFDPINQRGFVLVGSRVLRAKLTGVEHLDPQNPKDRRNLHELSSM